VREEYEACGKVGCQTFRELHLSISEVCGTKMGLRPAFSRPRQRPVVFEAKARLFVLNLSPKSLKNPIFDVE